MIGLVRRLFASQFMRFALVGVAGAVVDIVALTAMCNGLGMDPYTGRLPAFLLAATSTWALNRRLTFPEQTTGSVGEWLRYLLANALGSLVNLGVYAILVSSGIVFFARWPQAAVVFGALAGLVFNFTASRRYVFGARNS
ncbi:GtrA family protein [Zavarzinia sp. CC-PAN008]|uniref:GtrA family protein n=1 Tax=Zavarzinia sp. CC-PAN008 TaxID=3243332 RepID=UPI003F744675